MADSIPEEPAVAENTKGTPPIDSSRFSWNKLIHDGQEKLASLIDIEGPSQPRSSSDSLRSVDTDAEKKGSTILSSRKEDDGSQINSNKASMTSSSPHDDTKDKRYPESSIDRMRRTIMRYSEQVKEPEELAKVRSAKEESAPLKKAKKPITETPIAKKPASEAPTMMDKLIDRLVTNTLPTASVDITSLDSRSQWLKGQPPFSINTMSNNFRRMTTRTTVVYDTAYAVLEILEWRNPWFTLSVLSFYSYCVLNPRLLITVPLLFLTARLMVPAYMYRHPSDPTAYQPSNPIPAPGPPLSDASIPKPVPEISREFFYNMVDTQNAMVLYIDAFDGVLDFLKRFAFFDADECMSSLAYTVLLIASVVLYFAIPLIIRIVPWKFIFFIIGWFGLAFAHPTLRRKGLQQFTNQYIPSRHLPDDFEEDAEDEDETDKESSIRDVKAIKEKIQEGFWQKAYNVAHKEFYFYEPHEQREVEMFEIQVMLRNKAKPGHKRAKSTEPDLSAQSPEELKDSESKDPELIPEDLIASETGGHWEHSMYSTNPYLPILRGKAIPPYFPSSAPAAYIESRIGSSSASVPLPPVAATTLSEVLAPRAWQFVPGANWKLDMDANTWVSARGIPQSPETATEQPEQHLVVIDDEVKWVYDTHPVNISPPGAGGIQTTIAEVTGEQEQTLCVRRRRWTRICTRHFVKRVVNKQ